MVEREEWLEPGIRLKQSVTADREWGGEQPSAVPVFIGWDNASTMPATLLPVATWDQRPDCLREKEGTCLQETVRHYFDNGGGECFVLMGEPLSPEAELTREWWCKVSVPLLQEPTVTLVAVPQLAEWLERGLAPMEPKEPMDPSVTVTVAATFITQWSLLTACINRPDLFFVLDAPRRAEIASACITQLRQTQDLGSEAMRVALYGPHLETDYLLKDRKTLVLPPCGAVLGVYARSDVTEGVWKAPANELLHHVIKPEFDETRTHRWFDVDNVSINAIRSFVGRGTRIWGCRTLSHGTPFRYVQVRRTVTWIEANLKQICRFAVFEPNNEITWFQLRGLCRAWLRRLWLEGGLAGTDETDAFSVRIGLHESMTADDIDAGRSVVQIEVAVLHAAEFIEVKLELLTGHAQVRGSETS